MDWELGPLLHPAGCKWSWAAGKALLKHQKDVNGSGDLWAVQGKSATTKDSTAEKKGLSVTMPRPQGHITEPPTPLPSVGAWWGSHSLHSSAFSLSQSHVPSWILPHRMCWSRSFGHHTLLLYTSAQQDCSIGAGISVQLSFLQFWGFQHLLSPIKAYLYCQWIPGECLLQHKPLILTKWMSSIPNGGARNRLAHVFKRLAENSAIIWEYCYYFFFSFCEIQSH